LFSIRAGKIKAPLMLMNEIHDVGTDGKKIGRAIGISRHFSINTLVFLFISDRSRVCFFPLNFFFYEPLI
ncbi:MAG: hypothetical protein D3906_14830, partial [Candidatus Electrothrix sp. AUS1_2]|nr:hypothetical protein [Candidatus Electrothrix sp. AUS1_2]